MCCVCVCVPHVCKIKTTHKIKKLTHFSFHEPVLFCIPRKKSPCDIYYSVPLCQESGQFRYKNLKEVYVLCVCVCSTCLQNKNNSQNKEANTFFFSRTSFILYS